MPWSSHSPKVGPVRAMQREFREKQNDTDDLPRHYHVDNHVLLNYSENCSYVTLTGASMQLCDRSLFY